MLAPFAYNIEEFNDEGIAIYLSSKNNRDGLVSNEGKILLQLRTTMVMMFINIQQKKTACLEL